MDLLNDLWDRAFAESALALWRVVLVGPLAYVACITLLRVMGKRTLSKMNAFDLVVTVALGSTLAAGFVDDKMTVTRAVLALALLIALQYVVSWSMVRSSLVNRWARSEPTLLLFEGRMLEGALRQERVLPSEVRAAVRAQGIADLATVRAVVLETDGSLSVVRSDSTPGSALQPDVRALPTGAGNSAPS